MLLTAISLTCLGASARAASIETLVMPGPPTDAHADLEEGCSACIGGYRGRIGIFEFLDWDETFRSLVHDGASARALRDHLASVGFASMSADAGQEVRQGVTSPEEVWRVF